MESPAIQRSRITLLLAVSLLLATPAEPARADALPFDLPAVAVDAGAGATDVRVGDVDGDGRKDVVLIKPAVLGYTTSTGGSIVVRFGRPEGGYGPMAMSSGVPPYRGTLGDTDGDGASEIIALHPDALTEEMHEAQIWRILPDRSLAVVATIVRPPTEQLDALAAGDFDGDGDADIALHASDQVHVYRSDGGDVFTHVFSYAIGSTGFGDVLVTGDFNGDGRTDLAYNRSGGVRALLFAGAGFAYTVLTGNAGGGLDLVVANLDGDAADDLLHIKPRLYSDDSVQGIHIDLIRGGTLIKFGELAPDTDIRCVSAGDVDGDGLVDILSGSRVSRNISWSRNLGDGTYAAPVTRPAGGTPKRFAWIDLDGDGADDPVVASESGLAAGGIVTGPGAFSPPPGLIATVTAASWVEAGDFDGDGGQDFAVLGSSPATVGLHRHQPGDTWSRTDLPFGAVGRDLCVTDVDANGASDLVVLLGAGTPRVVVRRSDGAGGFHAPVEFEVPGALTVGAADLDGDGDQDLLALAPTSGRAWPLLGDGTGGFLPAADFAVPPGARDFVVLDVHDDGRSDLVTADGSSATVSVFQGLGNGLGFAPPVSHPAGGIANAIRAFDANGDGRLDLAVAGTPGPVAIHLRLGPGTFSAPLVQPATGPYLSDVRVGHIDGDAHPDLVALTSFTGSGLAGGVHFLRGNGDGTFEHVGAWFTGRDPRGLAFADFAGGASSDVLVTHDDGTVVLLPNLLVDIVGVPPTIPPGTPSLALHVSPSPASGPLRVEFVGRPDAVAVIELFRADGRRFGAAQAARADQSGRAVVVVPAPGRAGVYFVRATQDERMTVRQAVVVR